MALTNIANRKISILGAGWLGFPLAKMLAGLQASVNLASRTQQRLESNIEAVNNAEISTFLVDTENLQTNDGQLVREFLLADILIVNITNKNIPAFAELIEFVEASPIKQVIFVSSTSVYPDNNSVVVEDKGLELPEHPLSQIEQGFKQSNSFVTTVVRFSGLIGYERHPGRFFRNGKTIKNAQAKVNLIHRDDCLNILTQIINDDIWSEDFNVCSDNHPNKQEFYAHAAKSLGVEPASCESAVAPAFKIVDNSKIKTRLNYQFIYPDVMKMDFSNASC